MSVPPLFEYDRAALPDIREIYTEPKDGVVYHDFTFDTPFGYRRAASFVRPDSAGPTAGVLYVHWYEPWSPTSNRRQFLDEARLLAQRGVTSLLVETMWSDDDWFYKRTQQDDRQASIQQVIELRLALDLLLAQPGVDPRRIAYVGHDFGAMYGVLMGSVDPRPACYVLMAGAPRFPDWYLYYPDLQGEARQAYIESMQAFDPANHVARLSPAPVLFQFGADDFHVPRERAQAFYDSAAEPKTLAWYEAGHGLNEQAKEDRLAWLSKQLEIA